MCFPVLFVVDKSVTCAGSVLKWQSDLSVLIILNLNLSLRVCVGHACAHMHTHSQEKEKEGSGDNKKNLHVICP